MLKKSILLFLFLLLGVVGSITYVALNDGREKYSVSLQGVELPEYKAIDVDFIHAQKVFSDIPFMAGAVIDVDNDGLEELFLGGGTRQADGLFLFRENRFVDVADQAGLVKQGDDATLGALVLDLDGNGYRDLILSRRSGVWLYHNNGERFMGTKLDLKFSENSYPLGVAITDLNGDGHFDMFVPVMHEEVFSRYQVNYNQRQGTAENKLLLNNGDNSFTDITASSGLTFDRHGMQGLFVDIDNDKLQDLMVVYGEGLIRLYQNMGNLEFDNRQHPLADIYGLYQGATVGDYDSDGRLDFFVSNSGSTVPLFMVKGDLRPDQIPYTQQVLMKNIGDGIFEDVALESKLANYELTRGSTFIDLNLDGATDLVLAQNHNSWPLHLVPSFRLSGRVFLQNPEGQFGEIGKSAAVMNKSYSVTPLTADFNEDGWPDIVHVNLIGRSKVFLSQGGRNHSLKIRLPDSLKSLGAKVEVKTLGGKQMMKSFLVGKELCSDSSHILFFGLGEDKVTDVIVRYLDGDIDQTSGVFYNTTVIFN